MKPAVLKYTSTKRRPFRAEAEKPFMMVNHNRLLGKIEGCDGLKTGYFRAAGFSIAATAVKNGRRAVAIVLGAASGRVRDAEAKRMLVRGLQTLAMSDPRSAQRPAPGGTSSSSE